MQDGSVIIINIFELFKQTSVLMLARIALIVMILESEKDAFFCNITLLE